MTGSAAGQNRRPPDATIIELARGTLMRGPLGRRRACSALATDKPQLQYGIRHAIFFDSTGGLMGQVLVRNLDDRVIESLEDQSRTQGSLA